MLTPLIDLHPGEKGTIRSIQGGHKIHQRLCELGLTVGTEIELVSNNAGPIIVKVRGSKLALGRGISTSVFVERNINK